MKICVRLFAIVISVALITLALGRAPLRFLFVVSGSMEPVMPTGSLIIVRNGEHNFEVGQIITFQQDDILITHRIIQTGDDGAFYCVTKGDANLNPDTSFIRREEIIGRVVFISPPFMAPALRTIRGLSASS